MFELLLLLISPSEISPEKAIVKYVAKEKFVKYEKCEKYVKENVYVRSEDEKFEGVFYKVDKKEYRVVLTYCKQVDKSK